MMYYMALCNFLLGASPKMHHPVGPLVPNYFWSIPKSLRELTTKSVTVQLSKRDPTKIRASLQNLKLWEDHCFIYIEEPDKNIKKHQRLENMEETPSDYHPTGTTSLSFGMIVPSFRINGWRISSSAPRTCCEARYSWSFCVSGLLK